MRYTYSVSTRVLLEERTLDTQCVISRDLIDMNHDNGGVMRSKCYSTHTCKLNNLLNRPLLRYEAWIAIMCEYSIYRIFGSQGPAKQVKTLLHLKEDLSVQKCISLVTIMFFFFFFLRSNCCVHVCVKIGDNLRRKKKKELNTIFIRCKRIGEYFMGNANECP